MTKYKPVVLIILDGWGLSPSWGGNALLMNKPENFLRLWRDYPHKILQALGAIEYGNVVGESRLGHLMIGAGRPVSGSHSKINKLIKNGAFFKNSVLKEAFSWAKEHNSNVHLVGMISSGGVHSDVDHLLALLSLAQREDFDRVFVDAISDGVDSGPQDALKFIEKISKKMQDLKIGKFSTICGRAYAMDRDEHWDDTGKYLDLITQSIGEKRKTAEEAVSKAYREKINDDKIPPTLLEKNPIKEKDAVIFFNFREDRMRQIARVFLDPKFRIFLWKPHIPKSLFLSTFTNYLGSKGKHLKAKIAFPEDEYKNTLSEVLSETNCRQLKVAESEKISHITSFFNGNHDEAFSREERKIISSPDVASYDLRPEMSAIPISKFVQKAISSKKYDFILINFANVDMVAHTGDILAVGKAVQILDAQLKKIVETNLKAGGATIITADHGNAEQMVNINKNVGERETLHTLNPVPFILITADNKKNFLKTAISYDPNTLSKIMQAKDTLADVAPTVLELLNIPKPKEMTGRTLIGRLD